MPPVREDREGIGFGRLPEHLHRKSAKKGFDFTMMVVGDSGLGKSTLINCLFLTDLYKDRKIPQVDQLLERTLTIQKNQLDIMEKGVKLRVTIIDTPGYGDALNGLNSFEMVERYIDDQYEQYFKDESGLNRKNIVDNRVHCCLYFISPFGRGLSQLDAQFMKRLHGKVNIVPVIAKSDALTPTELHQLKKRILREFDEHGIQWFKIPDCDSDEDEDFRKKDQEIKEAFPFAIIGSTTTLEVNGRKIRGRQYPWGIVDIQDEQFSDFVKLRTFLSLHMQDLKDVTNETLYENYRASHLAKISRSRHESSSGVFEESTGIPEQTAEKLLQMKEEEIRQMQQQLLQMQQQLKIRSAPVSAAASSENLLIGGKEEQV